MEIRPIKNWRRWGRLGLFGQFTVLSLVAFAFIFYLLTTVLKPTLEALTISQFRSDQALLVNRLATSLLVPADFGLQLKSGPHAGYDEFFRQLIIPGYLGALVRDPSGIVVIRRHGIVPNTFRFEKGESFLEAAREGAPTSEFRSLEGAERIVIGGSDEIFRLNMPITFGTQRQVYGVIQIVSHSTFLRSAVTAAYRAVISRLLIGLAVLHITLSIIVSRASRTISRQARELREYAEGLEDKVRQRTRELEESTKRELAKAAEVARLKDEFVFVAAHELRLPAFVIKGNAELLRDDPTLMKLSADARENLTEIERAGDRLQALVNDLLSTARLEYGTVKFQTEPVALLPMLQKIIGGIRLFAKETNDISVILDEKTLANQPRALADSKRLEEVVMNVLTNAIKYNKPKGTVTVDAEQRDNRILLHIRDTGIGLTPEELSHLFSKFWRASSKVEGTGLGLWIAKHVIEKMDGEISVTSEKGKGSVFTIKLKPAAR